MKTYLTIVSVLVLLVYVPYLLVLPSLFIMVFSSGGDATPAVVIMAISLLPLAYATLNLIFLYKKDPPPLIRQVLMYLSLAIAIFSGLYALFALYMLLSGFKEGILMQLWLESLMALAVLAHGIIEYRYLKGISFSTLAERTIEVD